ncbi:conserved Plasmodium protein, unknown function [Plasmodium ovale curtisi]|uniref:MORN repeat protein n=1 Tax=Plasmodium ovale curtisi TaxID=864141 RepID=A0A1A8VSV1_PLAOA|nr:conserved Plasmodium protein, unknown function [Plasmodium ovale curtisi]SBS87784.1 conserved Plasmodium protein, unknown function [Plasmodium ovale curtisi]
MSPKKSKKGKLRLLKDNGVSSDSLGNYTGIGTVIFYPRKNSKTKEKYYGNFLQGEKHGYGEYEYRNGDFYQGSYEHNRRNGIGTYYYSNEGKKKGENKRMKMKNDINGEESGEENEDKDSEEEGNEENGSSGRDNDGEDSEHKKGESEHSDSGESGSGKSGSGESGSGESKSTQSDINKGDSEQSAKNENEDTDEGTDNDGNDHDNGSSNSVGGENNHADGKTEGKEAYKRKKAFEVLLNLLKKLDKSTSKKNIAGIEIERKSYYYGNYFNGLKHNEGMMLYKNGDIYVGNWKFGKKNGWGKYMYKNCKSVLEGHWTDGYLSHGKWTLPNGRNLFVFLFQGIYFIGNFRHNKPTGEGVWVFKDKTQLNVFYYQVEKKSKKSLEKRTWEDDPNVMLNCKPLYITSTRYTLQK